MNSGIITYSLRSIGYYLDLTQRRKAVVQLVLLLFSSMLDVFGLAALVPVLLVAVEPGAVQKSKYFSWIYQQLHFASERNFLLVLIATVFVFFIIKNAFSVWVNYVQVRFTAEIGQRIAESQLHKYLNFPYWYFNDLGSAQLINSSLTIPGAYVGSIIRPIFNIMSEGSIILVIVLGILIYKPLLFGILVFILVPNTMLTYRLLRERSQRVGNQMNKLRPISVGLMSDIFNGFVELRLAGKHPLFKSRVLVNQDKLQQLDAEGYLYTLVPVRAIEVIAILGILTIFLYALVVPSASNSLLSLVSLFAAAAYRLMPSINRILTALVQLKQGQYTIDDLEAFRTAEYQEPLHPVQQSLKFEQSLVLEHVSYTFPGAGKPALNNVSLTVRKGEKIGFVGSSGSGKTTLMNVLLRFYTEQQGQILIDGEPLTPSNLEAWHRTIGYVKQDTFLMETSIRSNITLGDDDVNEQRLTYAIKQASLESFVASLEDGLDTLIGERGSKLSGGQRQRIGIARALYKNTQLLILDEATSALDNETEREVNEAIASLENTDITILLIAHRITTLKGCNRIYELSQGEVIAQHDYYQLLERI
ncbi:MAG: ABC transporter ATP-binding protein [Hymenobacter sp.]|nr:MAG: ABC transporter ATP-binding protein [Hymenobacter sp.]